VPSAWHETPPYRQRIGCVGGYAPLFAGGGGERIGHFNTACCAPPGKPASTVIAPVVRALSHVSVYTLMKLLGHESMTISQR